MHAHNKVAISTGAGSGIGKTVALALLKDGYRVALAGRRKNPLEQTAKDEGERVLVSSDMAKGERRTRTTAFKRLRGL